MKKWLNAVIELVELAERRPTNISVEMNRFEKKAKANPKAAALQVALLLLGVQVAILFVFGLLMFILVLVQPWIGIVFLLLFMPFAFFMAARMFIRGIRSKMKEASRAGG